MQSTTPDITIFIHVPVEIALERCKKRSSLSAFEQKDFLKKVAQGFEELYKNRKDVIIVNGNQTEEIVVHQIYNILINWLDSQYTTWLFS
jgi:thymidylate kinase